MTQTQKLNCTAEYFTTTWRKYDEDGKCVIWDIFLLTRYATRDKTDHISQRWGIFFLTNLPYEIYKMIVYTIT